MPFFNQDILISYWPIVVFLIILEFILIINKWKTVQWNMKLVLANAIVLILSAVAFIIIISNPNLINEAFIGYLADLLNTPSSSVTNSMKWILWNILVIVVVTSIIEIFDSYRIARLR